MGAVKNFVLFFTSHNVTFWLMECIDSTFIYTISHFYPCWNNTTTDIN